MVKTPTPSAISKETVITRVLQKANLKQIRVQKQIPNKNGLKLTLAFPQKFFCKLSANISEEDL